MPRDSGGVYTLPTGNPVTAGTVIEDSWANDTMSDVAAQLNNVYTRDGLVSPTDPFLIVAGSAAAPGLAFNVEADVGLFRPAAGAISVSTDGVERVRVDSTGKVTAYYDLAVTGTLTAGTFSPTTLALPAGTATNPSYSFTGDPNTGIYSGGANILAFAADGSERAQVNTGGLSVTGVIANSAGTTIVPSYTFTGDLDTGMCRIGADILGFGVGGAERVRISTTNLKTTVSVTIPDGTAAAPSLSFTGETDAGLFLSTTNTIGLATAGTSRVTLSTTALASTLPLTLPAGSAAAPGLVFEDADSGLFSVTSSVGVACNGVQKLLVGASSIQAAVDVTVTGETTSTTFETGSGSAATPGYGFSTVSGTGLYYDSALKIALGSSEVFSFSTKATCVLELACRKVTDNTEESISFGAGAVALSSISATGDLEFTYNNNTLFSVDLDGKVVYGSYEVGYRDVPSTPASGTAYVLTIGDRGKMVVVGAATSSVTVPNSTFAAGDSVEVVNTNGSSITVTASVGTLRQAGTANTGNRTLAAYGMARIWFQSATVAYIQGDGLT